MAVLLMQERSVCGRLRHEAESMWEYPGDYVSTCQLIWLAYERFHGVGGACEGVELRVKCAWKHAR